MVQVKQGSNVLFLVTEGFLDVVELKGITAVLPKSDRKEGSRAVAAVSCETLHEVKAKSYLTAAE